MIFFDIFNVLIIYVELYKNIYLLDKLNIFGNLNQKFMCSDYFKSNFYYRCEYKKIIIYQLKLITGKLIESQCMMM